MSFRLPEQSKEIAFYSLSRTMLKKKLNLLFIEQRNEQE